MKEPKDSLVEESQSLEQTGQIGNALKQAQLALDQARQDGNPRAIATALVRLGNVHYRLGDYDLMLVFTNEALKTAIHDSHPYTDALILLGIHAFETDSLDKSEANFLEAVSICRRIDYTASHFRALHNLAACIYSLRGQFELAIAADQEAYHIANQIDSPQKPAPLIACAYNFLITGQLQRAAEIIKQIKPIVSEGSLYQGYYFLICGKYAFEKREYPEAISFLSQARSIAESIGDPVLHIFIRLEYSRYYQRTNKPSLAYEWANDGVACAGRASNHRMLGRALIERGRSAWLKGNVSAAMADFNAAIQDLADRSQYYDLTRALFFKAALLHHTQNSEADTAYVVAAQKILDGGFASILEQERQIAFPLVATHLSDANNDSARLSTELIKQLESIPPPALRIYCLGQFEVYQGNRVLAQTAFHRRQAGELLRLLLVSPQRSLSREQIMEILYPDKSPESALAAFHQATSALRRALEPDLPDKFPSNYLIIEEGRVVLNLPEGSFVDHEAFEQYVQASEYETAISLYQGEPFPLDCYKHWASWKREHIIQLYLHALLAIARKKLETQFPTDALTACQRILQEDPWQEQAVLLGMHACLALKNRPGAIRLYKALEQKLQTDFGISPNNDLQQLYLTLL